MWWTIPKRLRVRTLLIFVALAALAMGAGQTWRRWDHFRREAASHAASEQFCRDSAATFRCPEFRGPIAAASAAREAARHARLRRYFESRW